MPGAVRPPRRYDYIDDGPAIYLDSFATIRRELGGWHAGLMAMAGQTVVAYVAAFFCRQWAARCAHMRRVRAACAAAAGGREAEADGEAFCKVIVLQNDTKKRLSSLNNAIFCKNCG